MKNNCRRVAGICPLNNSVDDVNYTIGGNNVGLDDLSTGYAYSSYKNKYFKSND